MHSPEGWCEPIQTPEFDEYTLVIKGMLQVSTPLETYEVKRGNVLSRNVTNLCNTAPQKKMEQNIFRSVFHFFCGDSASTRIVTFIANCPIENLGLIYHYVDHCAKFLNIFRN